MAMACVPQAPVALTHMLDVTTPVVFLMATEMPPIAFLQFSGHQASLVCCCGVPSLLRFHPSVWGRIKLRFGVLLVSYKELTTLL